MYASYGKVDTAVRTQHTFYWNLSRRPTILTSRELKW
jgi:hypothetical protein